MGPDLLFSSSYSSGICRSLTVSLCSLCSPLPAPEDAAWYGGARPLPPTTTPTAFVMVAFSGEQRVTLFMENPPGISGFNQNQTQFGTRRCGNPYKFP